MSFKKGDKVIFNENYEFFNEKNDYIEITYKHTNFNFYLKHYNFDYFIVANKMKHLRRKNGIGYKITLPDGTYVAHVSEKVLIHFKNKNTKTTFP